jgi:hypothetical protein
MYGFFEKGRFRPVSSELAHVVNNHSPSLAVVNKLVGNNHPRGAWFSYLVYYNTYDEALAAL